MKSSWLLLKALRWQLTLCIVLEAAGFFLAIWVFTDWHPGFLAVHLTGLGALLPLLWLDAPSRLRELPVPVSPRQMGYIPMAAAAIVWTSGFGAAVLGLALRTSRGELPSAMWASFPREALLGLPITVTLVLMFLWAAGGKSAAVYVMFYLPILPLNMLTAPWTQAAVEAYKHWWPALLPVSLFYILAAPGHVVEAQRGLTTGEAGPLGIPTRVPDPTAPRRFHPATLIGNAGLTLLSYAVGLTVVVELLFPPYLIPRGLPVRFREVAVVSGILFAYLIWRGLVALGVLAYRLGLAGRFNSRVTGTGALIRTALRFSWWLKGKLRVKPAISRCGECRQYLFVPLAQCPHCGHDLAIDTPAPEVGQGVLARLKSARIPSRLYVGVLIPLNVAILGLFASGTALHFDEDLYGCHHATIGLRKVGGPRNREQVVARMREELAAAPDPSVWVAEQGGRPGKAAEVPQRFRVEIDLRNDDYVTIQSMGLPWSRAGHLADALAQYLVAKLKSDWPIFTITDQSYYALRPLFERPGTLLDNQVHWITPEQDSERTTTPPPDAPAIYVDLRNTSGKHNGKSWETAYTKLQEGIDAAYFWRIPTVWVAKGVYSEERPRTGAILLKQGVHVYGGFAGNETSRDQRNWEENVTVIDGAVARGGKPAFHVVVGTDNATLDGFTITGGKGDEPLFEGSSLREDYEVFGRDGGGMLNYEVSPTVANCVFTKNSAFQGGGMYNYHEASPTILNCTFLENQAEAGGGGVKNGYESRPTFISCSFIRNHSDALGGGVDSHGSTPSLLDCVFVGNTAHEGGGMMNMDCSPVLTRCTFQENKATEGSGGAVSNYCASPVLTNCLFWHNVSTETGADMEDGKSSFPVATNCTFFGAVASDKDSSVVLVNCIVWGGSPASIEGPAAVTYSNVRGGYDGEGNIDADPLFVDPANDDFHLQPESPCIDAGTTVDAAATDLDGIPRPQGAGIDMGAYER